MPKNFFSGFPSPLLRPRVDVAGTEGVREYLKQRFVPGVGVCFLLVFVVEISAFRFAGILAYGARTDNKLGYIIVGYQTVCLSSEIYT